MFNCTFYSCFYSKFTERLYKQETKLKMIKLKDLLKEKISVKGGK